MQAAQAGTGTVVARIESILELTLDRLAEAQEMSIELASRRNVRHRGDNTHLEQIRFPGRTLHEAKKFGMQHHAVDSSLPNLAQPGFFLYCSSHTML